MQNAALRKILEAFRISSVVVIKIEANLKSINIRLNQKNQKLDLRMLKMKKNHSIRSKISNFSLENWNETLSEQSREFSEWNQDDLHVTQLIKTMHSISNFITNEYLIEEIATIRNIWRKSSLEIEIDSNEHARDNHLKKIELILQNNSTVFYTDAAFNSKTKISTASCVLYQNSRAAYKTWNLLQAAIQKQNCGITWCGYDHVMWLRWLCTERDNFDSSTQHIYKELFILDKSLSNTTMRFIIYTFDRLWIRTAER